MLPIVCRKCSRTVRSLRETIVMTVSGAFPATTQSAARSPVLVDWLAIPVQPRLQCCSVGAAMTPDAAFRIPSSTLAIVRGSVVTVARTNVRCVCRATSSAAVSRSCRQPAPSVRWARRVVVCPLVCRKFRATPIASRERPAESANSAHRASIRSTGRALVLASSRATPVRDSPRRCFRHAVRDWGAVCPVRSSKRRCSLTSAVTAAGRQSSYALPSHS